MSGGSSSSSNASSSSSSSGESAKHLLMNEWTYYELRKFDRSIGMTGYGDCAKALFTFGTVEDFWMYWKHIPQLTDVFDGALHPAGADLVLVKRKEGNKNIVSKSEAYMLFRKGTFPLLEFKLVEGGPRSTLARRRCEIRPRPTDGGSWCVIWELMNLAVIGDCVDPGAYINGIWIQEKSEFIRLEVWFSTADEAICDAIGAEFVRLLQSHESLKSFPFRFVDPSKGKPRMARVDAASAWVSAATAPS